WDKFWLPRPPLGYTDVFALVKNKLMHVEGDLHPFMATFFISRMCSQPRGRKQSDEPALRANHRTLSASRAAWQAAPPLCGGGRAGHTVAVSAHSRLRRAPVSRSAE